MILMALLMVFSTVACDVSDNNSTRVSKESKKDRSDDKENDEDEDESDADTDFQKSEYNKCAMMVYIVGSNLESQNGLATMDIDEMIDSDYDEKLMDIYICTGGASKWHSSEISEDEIAIYKLEDEELVKLDTINTSTMASPNTLQTFINKVYEDTDSDCYNLILWNHGAGAVVGFGADETANYQAMTMPEIVTAIDGSNLIKAGKRFEIIGFDACLMGMIEVATSLDDYAHYLVASEELIPGLGWDYTCFGEITESGDFSGDNVGQIIVDAYAEYYKKRTKYSVEYSLACMDLTKAKKVISELDELASDGINELANGDYGIIAKARSKTKTFGRASGQAFYDTVDLYNLAENLIDCYPDSATAVMNGIDEMVIYYKSNIQRSHGVSVYFPFDNKDYADKWIETYDELESSDNYKIFLDGFVKVLNGESIAEWDIANQVAQQNANNKSQYSIQLTDEQAAAYAKGTVSIWKKVPGEQDFYECQIRNTDVTLMDDGTLVSNFDERVFYLSNGAGKEISCTIFEIDRNDEYVMYEGGLLVTPKGEYSFIPVNVYIRVDDQNPNGEIVGFYVETYIEDTNLFPQLISYQFNDGDSIEPFVFNRQAIYNTDGTVAPFDDWEGPFYYNTAYMKYDGEIKCELRNDSNIDTDFYFCLFDVEDTQGNYYYAGTFEPDERLTDGTYVTDGQDDTLSQDEPYNLDEGKAALYDSYGEQVVVINQPDGYEIASDSGKDKIKVYFLNDNGKRTTTHISIEKDPSYHYYNYLINGTVPSDVVNPDFMCEVESYSVSQQEILIATYDSNRTSHDIEKMALVPYIDCYGKQHYLTFTCYQFAEMSDDEIIEIVDEFIER